MANPTEVPITAVSVNRTVVLLNGITSNIDTTMSFHVTIEKMSEVDPATWTVVKDFGSVAGVNVTANVQKTFTAVYGEELKYQVPSLGVYRWVAFVFSEDRHPTETRESFYSYFTCIYNANETTDIYSCSLDCSLNIKPTDCDSNWLRDMVDEYFCTTGFPVEIYLVTKYTPIYVFGEDTNKSYNAHFTSTAIWDVSPENRTYGKFDRISEEPIILYLSKNMLKTQIKKALIDFNIFTEESMLLSDESVSKAERWRRELQEGDMIRTNFNNIHYEIDGIKTEPEYVYWLNKFVYQVHARPRLVAGEDLGEMQPVTDAEAIRQQNDLEIAVESEKILF